MPSPVPKYLRSPDEEASIAASLREHVVDIKPDPRVGVRAPDLGRHRAKYADGLATELLRLAGSDDVGDPMCGTGTLARETGIPAKLNDLDHGMANFLEPLRESGCHVSYGPAHEVTWGADVCVFSPPYYPRTDRRRPNAHDDAKRGPVVGFRDSYNCDHPDFVGNPGGVHAISLYREQMTQVYAHMTSVCQRMIVVTKNWTRLGVELRLDLDTILMAESVGWKCVGRHGFEPAPSLWARFNANRGGGVLVEDILIFGPEG